MRLETKQMLNDFVGAINGAGLALIIVSSKHLWLNIIGIGLMLLNFEIWRTEGFIEC